MRLAAQDVIDHLGLTPLVPEGGWFRETYRSDETVAEGVWPDRGPGARCASTAIYYLLTPGTVSLLHRLRSDEAFHFYLGDPAVMTRFWPDGRADRLVFGPNLLAGECVQSVVPRGVWQGMRLVEGGAWALLGCTVAPGFDYADFDLADREAMLRAFPDWSEDILALTP